jgi:hypothetical protein
MKKIALFAIIGCFCCCVNISAQVLTNCKAVFQGTIGQEKITLCLYPDEANGEISGFFFFEDTHKGDWYFSGQQQIRKDGTFFQRLDIRNSEGKPAGYWEGTLTLAGWVEGNWYRGDEIQKYALMMREKAP